MKWIDASDITTWISREQRRCSELLPELIRRLILANAPIIVEIEFPGGDSITIGGWDGKLNTPVKSALFPSGISGWEFGTENSIKKKADGDFDKRTNDSLGLLKKDTTFVFVTPHSWPQRTSWITEKKSKKIWKDVRVINADNLEQWLDLSPAVALWLARHIKIPNTTSIHDLEYMWDEWSLGTEPRFTPDIVIGGRNKDVDRIHQWLTQNPSVLEVQGDHPDEALAFLYAAISKLPDSEKERALSRCLFVEDKNELRICLQSFQQPLIIVVRGECIDIAASAAAKGHHVYVCMDAKVIGIRDIFLLSRPHRGEVAKALQSNGKSEVEAKQLSRDFGRSIPVLRRHLFRSNAVSAPAWANNDSARLLLPILFAGAWNEEKEEDRKIIEKLSGMQYADFVKKIHPFLSMDDSPINKVGNIWMIKSPLDAWYMLAQHINEDSLSLFQESITAVLTKTDPKYDLPAEKRWSAAIYGKVNPYSDWLRTGLVESLVLLAVYGNRSSHIASTQEFVNKVVKEIFASAKNYKTWASLGDVTPLLAEAAPDSFLKIVEQSLKKNPSLFIKLFEDDPGMFGECKHAGLLWGLESTAWSSNYFSQTVTLLQKLAEIDPGGKYVNRPLNSLRDIFMPKFPQTNATPEERLSVLNTLISSDAVMAWKFIKTYFEGGTFSEAHKFRWRDDGGYRSGLEYESRENIQKFLDAFLPIAKDLACQKVNIISTIDDFTRLPLDIQKACIKTLESLKPKSFSKEDLSNLRKCIREALNWINSYGDENIRQHVPGLNRLLKKYEPEDVIERFGWLLSNPWPQLPEGAKKGEHEARRSAVDKAQKKAARELLDKATLPNIMAFSKTIEYPSVLGSMLGYAVKSKEEDDKLLDCMLEKYSEREILIISYAGGRINTSGEKWVTQQITRLKKKGNYSATVGALLYHGLPENPKTWADVKKEEKDLEKAYWERTGRYVRAENDEDAAFAMEMLLSVKRPLVALEVAGDPDKSLPSGLLQKLILDLLEEKDFIIGGMDEFHLGHIFRQLYERNELPLEEIAKIEWPFARVFDDFRQYTVLPMAIHRLLQKDPAYFVEFVSFIYKRDDHSPDPVLSKLDQKTLENRARGAYEVLHSWHLLPGLKDDGTIDEKELKNWVQTAQKQLSAVKRTRTGEVQIAYMLAHAPMDNDGAWPHKAVRNVIEFLNSDNIDRHILIDLRNNRGVVTRSLNEGGQQERELAEKYKQMSTVVGAKWPRTAAILLSLSKSYESEAKREDIDTDLRNLRWD